MIGEGVVRDVDEALCRSDGFFAFSHGKTGHLWKKKQFRLHSIDIESITVGREKRTNIQWNGIFVWRSDRLMNYLQHLYVETQ